MFYLRVILIWKPCLAQIRPLVKGWLAARNAYYETFCWKFAQTSHNRLQSRASGGSEHYTSPVFMTDWHSGSSTWICQGLLTAAGNVPQPSPAALPYHPSDRLKHNRVCWMTDTFLFCLLLKGLHLTALELSFWLTDWEGEKSFSSIKLSNCCRTKHL